MTWLFYNGSEVDGREHFKAFLEIGKRDKSFDLARLTLSAGPIVDNTKEIPYEELNEMTVNSAFLFKRRP